MKKLVIKELFPHDWVTREAGEKLRKLIMEHIAEGVEIDFAGMKIASVSYFDEGLAKLKLEKLPTGWQKKILITNLNQWDKEVLNLVCKQREIEIPSSDEETKSHPWRLCPTGKHYVKEHDKKTKTGKTAHWHGFCRVNPSGKEIYTLDEIHEIAKSFPIRNLIYPSLYNEKDWNDFDYLIAGWTQFWNETFMPAEKLSANYVKALIATESKFIIRATAPNKKAGKAQGLVQITEETAKLLSPKSTELSDHYFDIGKQDIFDPNINICAAVRWLFRKRETAQARLKRIPSWYEVLLEYKGILNDPSEKASQIRRDVQKRLTELGEKL